MTEKNPPGPDFWVHALARRIDLFENLRSGGLGDRLNRLADSVARAMARDRKVLLFGNGGSAAAAQHAAGEWMGRFLTERNPLPAIALTTDSSILTAVGNDYGFDRIFERQVEALARPGDVAIGISTAGASENVIRGLRAAGKRRAHAAALLGGTGGRAKRVADTALIVPSAEIPLVQEAHGFLLHVLCEEVDRRLKAPRGGRTRRKTPPVGASAGKKRGARG
ncbi:MAG: SIS domain-containing protein [Nitrospinota bacterium]|nr:SIS domain-containing protein [Nitrospinota bacterium]